MAKLPRRGLKTRSVPRICDETVYRRIKALDQDMDEEELAYRIPRRLLIFPQGLVRSELFYVPCWYVLQDYSVQILGKRHTRAGQVLILVDQIRGCLVAEAGVKLNPKPKDVADSRVVADTLNAAQAEKKAMIEARWKVVLAKHKQPPELETVKVMKFYRPYFRAQVVCMGKPREQWIPADGFDNYYTYQ